MNNKNKELQEVMLRRKGKVLLGRIDQPTKDILSTNDKNGYMEFMTDDMKRTVIAATVAHNMSYLGYVPSKELMHEMVSDETVSQKINEYIIPELKKLKGADVEYKPMYKNFPQEVMDMNSATLYMNAILHYFSNGQWSPESIKENRLPLTEDVKLKTIDIGTDKDCTSLFANILNSNTPYSPQDKDDIITLSEQYDIYSAIPDFIVNRENLETLTKVLYDKADNKGEKTAVLYNMSSQTKTVNDVLRIANTIFGDGDPTLTEKITIKKVSRAERKALLSLIENCPNKAEDMKINTKMWIKIGEVLHPGEFKEKFPQTADAFNKIRSNQLIKHVKTYNSIAEQAITSKDNKQLLQFAQQKPGVIARNLDRLMRNSDNPNEILSIWDKVANNVAPTLLWQVHSHFRRRCDEYNQDSLRIFTTKGLKSKTKVMEDKTKEISLGYYKNIVSITEKALKEVYKDKPPMGKVYIDPQVAQCKVPNGTRDAQKSSNALAKGSHIPFGNNTNVIRGFVWWTNLGPEKSSWNNGRVDIDLSAAMMDKDLKLIDRCSFYSLKGNCYSHSGDIVDGENYDSKGVAEFIDIDINNALKKGVRYFVFTVNNFTNQPYCDMEHAHFGFMERERQMNGKIFEPSTVQQLIKLNAHATASTVCMFDIEKREMIWMDEVGMEAAYGRGLQSNTVDANWQGTSMACYKVLHMEKPNIADVIRINTEARGGEIVYNKTDAELVFGLNEGITPTDLDYFSGELMPKEVSSQYIVQNKQENEQEQCGNQNVTPKVEIEER